MKLFIYLIRFIYGRVYKTESTDPALVLHRNGRGSFRGVVQGGCYFGQQ